MKLKNVKLIESEGENGCIVEIEMMQIEILKLKGKPREGAMKAYHELIIRCENKPIFLVRA